MSSSEEEIIDTDTPSRRYNEHTKYVIIGVIKYTLLNFEYRFREPKR